MAVNLVNWLRSATFTMSPSSLGSGFSTSAMFTVGVSGSGLFRGYVCRRRARLSEGHFLSFLTFSSNFDKLKYRWVPILSPGRIPTRASFLPFTAEKKKMVHPQCQNSVPIRFFTSQTNFEQVCTKRY
jgi:hypothetical protein